MPTARAVLLAGLGGVVGGIFNALVAPLVFTLVFEYPVAMAACLLLRPWRVRGHRLGSDPAGDAVVRAAALCVGR